MYHAIWRRYKPLADAILLANILSILLLASRVWFTGTYRFWFMIWNLLLAWVPLAAVAVVYERQYRRKRIDGWAVAAGMVWLLFLPNCFYMLTDLIHLHRTAEVNIVFDAVLLSSFIANGFLLGYISVYVMHRQLLRRWNEWRVASMLSVVFLLCGFAIYLGRVLRWNSWDVLLNPAGLLFDVSDGVINPLAHPQVLVTTVTFFMFVGVFYLVGYRAVMLLGGDKRVATHKRPRR